MTQAGSRWWTEDSLRSGVSGVSTPNEITSGAAAKKNKLIRNTADSMIVEVCCGDQILESICWKKI